LKRTVSVMITVITGVMITEATDAHAKQAKKTEAECKIRRSPIAPRKPMTEAA
jgi:hypothetical protein